MLAHRSIDHIIYISLVSSCFDEGLGSEVRFKSPVDRAIFLNQSINAHQLEGAGIDVVALSLSMHLRFLRKKNPANSELLAVRRSVSAHHRTISPQCNHIPVAVTSRTEIGCVSLFAPLTLTKSSGCSKKGNGRPYRKSDERTQNLGRPRWLYGNSLGGPVRDLLELTGTPKVCLSRKSLEREFKISSYCFHRIDHTLG